VGCAGAPGPPAIPPIDQKPRAAIEFDEEPDRAPAQGAQRAPRASVPSSGGGWSSGRGDRLLITAFAVVVALALIGTALIFLVFDSGDPEPAVAKKHFPNVSHQRMASDIRDDIERWYDYIDKGQYDTAWDYLSERKRRQVEDNVNGLFPYGKESWREGMRSVRRKLKFGDSNIDVQLLQPSYPEEAVMTIRLKGVSYDTCDHKSGGITWVAYDAANDRWLYEPGVTLTPQRRKDWGKRRDVVTHNSACY